MTPIEVLDRPLDEAERNRRIYLGHVLVFRNVGAAGDLVTRLRSVANELLGSDPTRAHEDFDASAQAEAAAALRKAAARDSMAREMLRTALREVGVSIENTYGDPLKFRYQPPAAGQDDAFVAPLEPHRDTWGSNIMAQTNWWAPVFPIAAERTLALFPQWFRTPISNTSATWDLDAFLEARKAGTPYPLLPVAEERPAPAAALPIVIQPGDLLCFSGAHLHASVPNTTGQARLSMEWRTVHGADAMAGRGAPNVDGAAPWVTYHWFKNIETDARLGERQKHPAL